MKRFDLERLERGAYGIRRSIVETIATNGEGHVGGALSSTDVIATLFLSVMDLDRDPLHRDKFLLSGGHKCLALYGALAELGILQPQQLKTYNQLGAILPGHPDATKIPAIDFSTGSLGHGLPLGCGYAMAARIGSFGYRTYVLMGDGEQGEGSNWEAAAFAAHNHLDSLTAIIDENGLQINGKISEVCMPGSFEERYTAFGWSVRSVDGHDYRALYDAFAAAPFEPGKPSLIVAKTTKGKGVSFLEGNVKYHHWNPDKEQGARAATELDDYGKTRGWLK
ncbi:MAG: transketolase [Clostridia bacterium]|nr:transketolase [Clostridia bacterium]